MDLGRVLCLISHAAILNCFDVEIQTSLIVLKVLLFSNPDNYKETLNDSYRCKKWGKKMMLIRYLLLFKLGSCH